ncbi:TetR/AcrR family transcriptional regulator [Amycolatopsis roodepoortensis]|uniref:TetR/AcrR family transcriptional regulator n=1 Tax=Amycolatopsis roodepoortensis TaxID=700274 RepID=UPI00214B96FE|nr:TetR/AcrR family transcriptional regulator [Amycolatopsis roodepoortensis]UUV34528.1 TetR/AcrR family transcriptional regulator [Amycolatopsis roodepoortensis]
MPTFPEDAGPRPRSRAASGRPAVTRDRIVDAALELSAESGLENWTLRQLAAAVDAYPAVVYHHVGDRDTVVVAVLDRVVGELTLPDETLPWREWFAEFLPTVRKVLRRYPGSARRLALFGPSVAAAVPTMNTGIGRLLAAGFGTESPFAYNLLLATACQFVAMEDDRESAMALQLDRCEGYASYRTREDLPGMAALGESISALVADPDLAAGYYERLYDYAVQRCLDGLALRLTQLNALGSLTEP